MLYAISMNIKEGDVFQDTLYSDYVSFFEKLGCRLVLIPNSTGAVKSYFDNLPIKGIILSGGNDLSSEFTGEKNIDIRNAAPLRDLKEKEMLDIAVERKLPVFGICRGMQFINCYFGGSLSQGIHQGDDKDNMHIAKTHTVNLSDRRVIDYLGKDEIEVNSYHHQGIKREQISSKLKIMGLCANDDFIEGLFHPQLPMAGIQWHPERKNPTPEDGARLVSAFLKRELYWEKIKI